MKVVVLAPSPDYAANAGARIRYGRIVPALADSGIGLSIEHIGNFDPRTAACDVVVISKCYDASALVAAEILSRRGVKVGIDLFDDYFSQTGDSRLDRFRAWFRQIIAASDFAICSTPVMASVITGHAAGLPLHVLNDPAPRFDDAPLLAVLREKLSEARASGRIRLGWFGIGDNPMFPVGLSDVAAFSGMIGELAGEGLAVELSILTNVRSLDAARLAMIADLPVATTVDIWSEEREADLLRRSLLCILPVNAQRFSAAKSLNRAVTALVNGCQLLSVGYPLYAPLDPLVYRDAADFLGDLRKANMRLSPSSLGMLRRRVDEFASPLLEAGAFAAFLRNRVERAADERSIGKPLYLIHGLATSAAAHDLVKAAGGVSVGSPFCTALLDFDVLFEMKPGIRLTMLLSEGGLAKMAPADRRRLAVRGRISGRKYWEIPDERSGTIGDEASAKLSLSLKLAFYPSIMRSMSEKLTTTFGPGRTLFSENSPLPFEPAI